MMGASGKYGGIRQCQTGFWRIVWRDRGAEKKRRSLESRIENSFKKEEIRLKFPVADFVDLVPGFRGHCRSSSREQPKVPIMVGLKNLQQLSFFF
jgi:hypothetical protein